MTRPEVRAEVQVEGLAEPGLVDALHEAAAQLWSLAQGVPPVDRISFETAVVEITTNVVRHTVPVRDVVHATALLRVTPDSLEAELTDDGAVVDVDLHPPEPDDLATSGRGILLVQRSVHHLEYLRRDGYNVWRLSRSLVDR